MRSEVRAGRREGAVAGARRRRLGDLPLASRGGRHSKNVDKPRRGGLTPLAKSSPL